MKRIQCTSPSDFNLPLYNTNNLGMSKKHYSINNAFITHTCLCEYVHMYKYMCFIHYYFIKIIKECKETFMKQIFT